MISNKEANKKRDTIILIPADSESKKFVTAFNSSARFEIL